MADREKSEQLATAAQIREALAAGRQALKDMERELNKNGRQ